MAEPGTSHTEHTSKDSCEARASYTLGRRSFLAASAIAAASASALTLSGCKKPVSENGNGGGTLQVFISEPVSIDPYNLQESEGTQVGSQIFDSLTTYNFKTDTLEPAAAESWESNADGTQFTFHLRDGAVFHNGDPVDAQSFKRAWERIVSPKTNPESPSVISYHLAMVDGYGNLEKGTGTELTGVTCPDPLTLVVRLSEPYADFPFVVSHPALGPVPEVALEDFQKFFLAPIGNGPFMMREGTEWESGQYIELVANKNYYGTPPSLDGVYFNIQKDTETAYREFQAGNIDVAHVPVAQLQNARKTYGVSEDGYTMTPHHEVLDGAQASIYYLTINTHDPVLGNRYVRRALSLAINRDNICQTVFKGMRSPADNMVPPGINGYQEGAWKYARFDPEEATRILDSIAPIDATFSDGTPMRSALGTIKLSSNVDGGHKETMEVIMNDFKDLGISAELDQGEWASILSKYQSFDYQIGRLGWVSDYPILDNFLYPLFYTGSGDNRSGFSNATVDALIDKARSLTDEEERIRTFQEANSIVANDSPVIPIMFYKLDYVGSERVDDVYIDPQMLIHMEDARLTF